MVQSAVFSSPVYPDEQEGREGRATGPGGGRELAAAWNYRRGMPYASNALRRRKPMFSAIHMTSPVINGLRGTTHYLITALVYAV